MWEMIYKQKRNQIACRWSLFFMEHNILDASEMTREANRVFIYLSSHALKCLVLLAF